MITITKSSASKQFMLAQEYSDDGKNLSKKAQLKFKSNQPPIGWVCEEKYDGYRARYHPQMRMFYSRSGHTFPPKGIVPEWLISAMPHVHLDGELYRGRGAAAFQKMGEIKRHNPSPQGWQGVKYVVYDLPEYDAPYSERKKELINIVEQCNTEWIKTTSSADCPRWMKKLPCPIEVSPHCVIKSKEQLQQKMDEMISNDGEGLMLKDPNALYEGKRSPYLLKMKALYDDEAVIVGYEKGNGKYSGMLGAFICNPLSPEVDGKRKVDTEFTFTMSGMTDKVRKNYKKTHPIGTFVTFLFNDRTVAGRPRHPRYQRIRDDVNIDGGGEPGTTADVLNILEKICNYEKSQKGGGFKVKNYRKAMSSVKTAGDIDNYSSKDILAMDGVGKSTGEKISQILETGTCDYYESFKNQANLEELFIGIQGVGPVKAKELVDAGITTIEQLRVNQNLLNDTQKMGLKYYKDLLKRIPRAEGKRHELKLLSVLDDVTDGVADGLVSGSYRRGVKNSGDIDFLIKIPGDEKTIFKAFIDRLMEMKYLVSHLAYGDIKYNGICRIGTVHRRIDIMFCTEKEFPFAVFYFTGSGGFNIAFRKMVADKGYRLNEHGLTKKTGSRFVPVKQSFATELDIFDFFGVQYVEPCDRTEHAIKFV